jgi:hypothetical protein
MAGEAALRERLRHADEAGELPAGADPDALAGYFTTMYQGIAVQAAGGATTERLHRIVDVAMTGWPRQSPGN